MLVFLDLDDCLIDTSNSITSPKLKLSLEAMQKKGLQIDDFQKFYNHILKIDSESESSLETLKKFLISIGADKKYFDIGCSIIQGPIPKRVKVNVRKGAVGLLEELKKSHVLALVTIGDEAIQMDKLRKAGIDSAIFSIISILRQGCKKDIYRSIVKKNKMDSSVIVACGDRVNSDLKPAKELGYKTIHTRWGRGKKKVYPRSPYVDYEVTRLCEIISIIKELENNV